MVYGDPVDIQSKQNSPLSKLKPKLDEPHKLNIKLRIPSSQVKMTVGTEYSPIKAIDSNEDSVNSMR